MTSNNNSLPGVVLIAGGTQGLGRGIAIHLADIGVKKIIICGKNEKKGNEVVQSIRARFKDGYFIKSDLSKVSECKAVFEFCEKNFFALDGLVYAAGVTERGTIETTNEAMWDKIMNTNLKGAFFLIQELLPLLRKGSGKSIVTICSFSSYCGRPELIAYNTSKAGLVTFTRSLANALKEEKIRTNGINLGWTDTDNERYMQKLLGNSDEWFDEIGKRQPFERLINTQDVAYLVEYLLGCKSEMMTGSIIDFNQKVRV
jgi:NAD(P)-dependent dehydrogenase (short-subunit alcohol dehydrogenase family)